MPCLLQQLITIHINESEIQTLSYCLQQSYEVEALARFLLAMQKCHRPLKTYWSVHAAQVIPFNSWGIDGFCSEFSFPFSQCHIILPAMSKHFPTVAVEDSEKQAMVPGKLSMAGVNHAFLSMHFVSSLIGNSCLWPR